MRESSKDTRALKGDSDPVEDITVSYQCQYNVTNTDSVNVTAMVEIPSIDLGILEPRASVIFLLDYNGTAGVCPNVTVSASASAPEEECTADNIFDINRDGDEPTMTSQPSSQPSSIPSDVPSEVPSDVPSDVPTKSPSSMRRTPSLHQIP